MSNLYEYISIYNSHIHLGICKFYTVLIGMYTYVYIMFLYTDVITYSFLKTATPKDSPVGVSSCMTGAACDKTNVKHLWGHRVARDPQSSHEQAASSTATHAAAECSRTPTATHAAAACSRTPTQKIHKGAHVVSMLVYMCEPYACCSCVGEHCAVCAVCMSRVCLLCRMLQGPVSVPVCCVHR